MQNGTSDPETMVLHGFAIPIEHGFACFFCGETPMASIKVSNMPDGRMVNPLKDPSKLDSSTTYGIAIAIAGEIWAAGE